MLPFSRHFCALDQSDLRRIGELPLAEKRRDAGRLSRIFAAYFRVDQTGTTPHGFIRGYEIVWAGRFGPGGAVLNRRLRPLAALDRMFLPEKSTTGKEHDRHAA